ncbi:MAG: hypothetical protein AB7E70_19720 [Hyphomicrobiaceae bacterium]
MIPPLLLYLASALLRLLTAIAQPRTAQCPRGWYMNGVRPSGTSECILAAADPRSDDTKGRCDHEHLELPALPVRVRCAAGEIAVVVDARTAGCRRRNTH